MKALIATSYGPLDRLAVTECPLPTAGPGQILVRVEAAALNPLDVKLVTGDMRELMPIEHPFVVGMDAAGVVAAVGEGVFGYAVGDDVVAYTHFHPGTIAEFTLVDEGPNVTHRPAGLDVVRGAALPAVSLTALGIVATAQLEPGQSMLVVGATGGVGSFIVQLAAQAGVQVLATATAADTDYARSLGARSTIDYTSTDVVEHVLVLHPDGVDVIVDLINAGPALATTARAVKPGGKLLSTLGGPPAFGAVVPVYVRMSAQDGQLQQLAERAAAGELTIDVVATYPFADAPTALADFAAGKHSRGKVVITF